MESKRKIGLLGAISISIGFAIGAGIFVVIPQTVAMTGTGAVLAFALAAIPMIFGALSALQISGTFPVTGGAYMVNTRYTHPGVAFAISAACMLGLAATTCFSAYSAASYISLYLPGVNLTVISIIIIVAFCIFNMLGVKLMSRIESAMAIFLILIILVFIFGGSTSVDTANFTSVAPNGFGMLAMATGLAVFCWLGISTLTNYAGEIKQPKKTVPKALFLAILILGVMYCATATIFSGNMSIAAISTEGTTAAVTIASNFLPGAVVHIITIGIILAILTTVNAIILVVTREMVSWSNQKVGPTAFGRFNPKSNVPTFNILIFLVVTVIFSLFTASLEVYALMVVPPTMLYMINQAIAVYRMTKVDTARYEAATIKLSKRTLMISLIGNIVFCGLIIIFSTMASAVSTYVAVIMMVLAFVYYLIRRSYLKGKGIDLAAEVKMISQRTEAEIIDQ